MACSMGTSVGYDRARNKVSGGPMAYPLAHCQLESRSQSDTFVSTLLMLVESRLSSWSSTRFSASLSPSSSSSQPLTGWSLLIARRSTTT